MTRATTTAQQLAGNAGVVPVTAPLDADNGHAIPTPDAGRLLLVLTNSGEADATATVLAGFSHRAALGDLDLSIPAGSAVVAGPFESARFTQLGSELHLDLSAGAAGTVAAYLLPRSA